MDFSDIEDFYDDLFNEMKPTISPSESGIGIVSSLETPLTYDGEKFFVQFRHERRLPPEPSKKSIGYDYHDLIDSDYVIVLKIDTSSPLRYVGEYLKVEKFSKKFNGKMESITRCFDVLHKDLGALDKWLQTATSLYHDRLVTNDWTQERSIIC